MRTLLRLVIIGLILHAMWRVGPVYWTHVKFKDEVEQTARFSGDRTEAQIVDRIMTVAKTMNIPLYREQLHVRTSREMTNVDARYTANLEVLPTYFYPWEFEIKVDAFHVRPIKAEDLR